MKKDSTRLQYMMINLDFALTAKGKTDTILPVQVSDMIDFKHQNTRIWPPIPGRIPPPCAAWPTNF
jgi:hypothetical protein